MSSMNSATQNLRVTVQQAAAYLTAPLLKSSLVPAHSVRLLENSLISLMSLRYRTNGGWNIASPLEGAEKRVLSISSRLPAPQVLARACEAAQVSWSTWFHALGGARGDLDVFVDPGRVSYTFRQHGHTSAKTTVVWQDESFPVSKTDLLSNVDDDADIIFGMIQERFDSPSWVAACARPQREPITPSTLPLAARAVGSPILRVVTVPKIAPVPSSAKSAIHSRSSSATSLASASSAGSSRASDSSGSPLSTTSALSPEDEPVLSWRRRPSPTSTTTTSQPASLAFVPRAVASKSSAFVPQPEPFYYSFDDEEVQVSRVLIVPKECVTKYDGGKTTVLSGGVTFGVAKF